MLVVARQRKQKAVEKGPAPPEAAGKRKRNVVFVSLDDATEDALQRFLKSQRVPPDRGAVGFTAIVEFLTREGFRPDPA